MRKKDLELLLSRLEGYVRPRVQLEQYQTPGVIVAELLWDAFQKGDVQGKVLVDMGCGSGILGFGALLLGARKVFFVDVDADAVALAKKNLRFLERSQKQKYPAAFCCCSFSSFQTDVDVVFQNPPFGTKIVHADRAFLEKGFSLASVVYSFHKFSTRRFIERFAAVQGFRIRAVYRYRFPLRAQFHYHTSRLRSIDVACWCFEKY